jgi:cytochrome P450
MNAPQPSHPVDLAAPVLDVNAPFWATDPHPAIDAIRHLGPFVASTRGLEAIEYAVAFELLRDRRLQTDHMAIVRALGITAGPVYEFRQRFILSQQGADHARLRRPFITSFSPAKAEQMRSQIRTIVDSRVDTLDLSEPIDLFAEVFNPVPALVYCSWVGAPASDAAFVTGVSDQILGVFSGDPAKREEVEAGFNAIFPYIDDLIARRRTDPGDDILSAFIAAHVAGELTERDLVDQATALLEASTDNTAHQMALVIAEILERPGLWSTLARDPELIPAAVDEGIRIQPRSRLLQRVATEDLEIGNQPITAGQTVNICILAAEHDPHRYPDPHAFDLGRRNSPALTFGGGIYSCVGAYLARIEIQETLAALIRRFPHLELAAPVTRHCNAYVGTAPSVMATRAV